MIWPWQGRCRLRERKVLISFFRTSLNNSQLYECLSFHSLSDYYFLVSV
ncbi:hypothetical protein BVRB_6g134190 [Beta vulgaris subsp. vulgaris]|nr:hypothetical protein BVRB_6g134190 [Beta vulgaris subsp. vulgaris]